VQLESFAPHLVITDLVMPHVDGFEFTRQLRQSPGFAGLPVIAVSASVFADDRRKSHAAGCDLFIPKPIRARALFDGLQNLLGLNWRFEDGEIRAAAPMPTPPPESDAGSLSPQQAATLHELAMMGDVAGLERCLDEWQHAEPGLEALLDEIRQLTREFQLDEICDLVSPYLDLAGR
jgi:CheY-like chemotaxis protein